MGLGAEPPSVQARLASTQSVQAKIFENYLGNYPQDAPARFERILMLRESVVQKQRILPATKNKTFISVYPEPWLVADPVVDLNPKEDLALWGPSLQHYKALFENGGWVHVQAVQKLFAGFPQGTHLPERRSPGLREIFRQHYPKIRETLIKAPSQSHVWMWYVLASMMLDDTKAHRILDELELPLGTAGCWPRLYLAWRAEQAEDWPWFLKHYASWFKEIGKYDEGQIEAAVLQRYLLRSRFLPYLKALEALNLQDEAARILGYLNHSRSYPLIWRESEAFMKERGRLAWLQHLKPPNPQEGRPFPELIHGRNPLLVFQGFLEGFEPKGLRIQCLNLKSRENRFEGKAPAPGQAPVMRNLAQAWRDYLGWSEKERAWALLTIDGKILGKGNSLNLNNPAENLEPFGIQRHETWLKARLLEHPDHLDFRFQFVSALAQRALDTIRFKDSKEVREEAWATFSDELEAFFRDEDWPLALLMGENVFRGGLSDWIPVPGLHELPHWTSHPKVRSLLPNAFWRLVTVLEGDPGNPNLWRMAFRLHTRDCGTTMGAILARFGTRPESMKSIIPPVVVAEDQAWALAQENRDWQMIHDILKPRIEAETPGERWEYPTDRLMRWTLFLESLLQLGRNQEVEEWMTIFGRSPKRPPIATLAALAKHHECVQLEARWKKEKASRP